MAVPTKSIFVAELNGWDETTLSHPILRVLRKHVMEFDKRDYSNDNKYFHPDWCRTDPMGITAIGRAASIEARDKAFALFSSWSEEPRFAMIAETEDGGYAMMVSIRMYCNLAGEGGEEVEKTQEDCNGKKWEYCLQVAFRMQAVRDEDGYEGLKCIQSQAFVDPTPVMVPALKKGLVKLDL
jgi:hypothetical protein